MTRSVLRSRLYACMLVLALIGIAARALVPAGFMPDIQQSSGIALVICSGIDEKTIYVDDRGQPAPVHKDQKPCEFSCTSHAVTPAVPFVLQAQGLQTLSVPHIPESAVIAFAMPAPPSRGPPLSSI